MMNLMSLLAQKYYQNFYQKSGNYERNSVLSVLLQKSDRQVLPEPKLIQNFTQMDWWTEGRSLKGVKAQ